MYTAERKEALEMMVAPGNNVCADCGSPGVHMRVGRGENGKGEGRRGERREQRESGEKAKERRKGRGGNAQVKTAKWFHHAAQLK